MNGVRGLTIPIRAAIPACRLLTLLTLLSLLFTLPLTAQTDLTRISAVERSDGQGIVIRYHLSQAADSFQVHQPKPELIQLTLWSESIDTSGIRLPDSGNTLREVILHRTDEGFGSDIMLQEEQYLLARAYLDQNGRDLLVALTRTDRERLTAQTRNLEPIIWPSGESETVSVDPEELIGEPSSEPALPESTYAEYDEFYLQMRENSNFNTVVIDAGHGGRDPGTIGHGGIYEKNITLAVAKKLGAYIKEHMPGVNVVYTRDDDTFIELRERGRIANQARGDLFVSIHANSFPRNPNVRGVEVYFLGLARTQSALEVMKRENSVLRLENGNGSDELTEEDLIIYELANAGNLTISERIAEKMEYQFRERAQRHSRGVKQAQFMVLYHASMPALLVELGFITNPDEARFLNSDYGQSIVASALFRAIRDYKDQYERSRNVTRSSE